MKLALFQKLRPAMQVRFALTMGTYLIHRSQGELALYHLAGADKGFFVEVAYVTSQKELVVVRSFANAAPLEDYLVHLALPAL